MKCPDNLYTDLNQSSCNSCNITCKSCKGPLENDCLSCDIDSGFTLKNGFCLKEGSCPNGYIMQDYKSCLKPKQCIETAILNLPKIFNLELNPYIEKFIFKIKDSCTQYIQKFWIKWDDDSGFYEKAIKASDNSTYTILRDDLKETEISLRINIFYEKYSISSFNQTSILVLNNVIRLF